MTVAKTARAACAHLSRDVLWIVLRENGEPVGVRTQDLLIKSQLLYRLSYGLGAALGAGDVGRTIGKAVDWVNPMSRLPAREFTVAKRAGRDRRPP